MTTIYVLHGRDEHQARVRRYYTTDPAARDAVTALVLDDGWCTPITIEPVELHGVVADPASAGQAATEAEPADRPDGPRANLLRIAPNLHDFLYGPVPPAESAPSVAPDQPDDPQTDPQTDLLRIAPAPWRVEIGEQGAVRDANDHFLLQVVGAETTDREDELIASLLVDLVNRPDPIPPLVQAVVDAARDWVALVGSATEFLSSDGRALYGSVRALDAAGTEGQS